MDKQIDWNEREQAVWDAHKRSHGVDQGHRHWDDSRWYGEWYADPRVFMERLAADGYVIISKEQEESLRELLREVIMDWVPVDVQEQDDACQCSAHRAARLLTGG